ncbi:MAG: hypothetical protein KGQ95_00555 [Acidobacteria bacterium]|nr:hypothetical protein [Acidobacteriota bacterium]
MADPAANPWGALVVGLPGTQAEGVEAMCWFADGNALVSALAMEIPLWNVNPADEEDAHRARQLASMGQRIVAGGGAGDETFAYSAPAVKHLLQQDADVRWLGKVDDLMTSDDALAVELRAAFTSGDGAAPVADAEREAFTTFLRERYA